MHHKKSILFLSAIDFKEKSIQVIRKTPEAYVKAGWDVHYIVMRDNAQCGNYFYEKEINPEGVAVYRMYLPYAWLKDKISSHLLQTIVSKLLGFITVIKLYLYAREVVKMERIDVIYGYEIHGVLAARLFKFLNFFNKYKYVHRFQGTWIMQYIKDKRYGKLLLNFDAIIAMRFKSNLCIMTDDGTQGLNAMEVLKSNSLPVLKFWINGVDDQVAKDKDVSELKKRLNIDTQRVFLSVCRLEGWKRVDRAINAISKLKDENIKYIIVGDGAKSEELKTLVNMLDMQDKIVFTGAVENHKIKHYLALADFFLSTYDLSNVGNPLLEAIRANKVIFTLNNGDTKSWIKHNKNGFIYNIDKWLIKNMSEDMLMILNNNSKYAEILTEVRKTEVEKLWRWDERMNAEIKEVEGIIHVG